jgi:HrpA-like RNA helicase
MRNVLREFASEDNHEKNARTHAANGPRVVEYVVEGEVDDAIGRLAHEWNASYIVTPDTDMLIIPATVRDSSRDLTVIFTQLFPWGEFLQASLPATPTLVGFTRSALCRRLGLHGLAEQLTALQRYATGQNLVSVGLDETLLLAASITGNDITNPTAKSGNKTRERKIPSAIGLGDIAAAAALVREACEAFHQTLDSQLQDQPAAVANVVEALRNPLVLQSITAYRQAGGTAPACLRGGGIGLLTALAATDATIRTEVDVFVRAYHAGKVPAASLPLLVFGASFRKPHPFQGPGHNGVSSLPDLGSVATFDRLATAIEGLMHRQRAAWRLDPSQSQPGMAVPPCATVLRRTPNDDVGPTWHDIYTAAEPSKLRAIRGIFSFQIVDPHTVMGKALAPEAQFANGKTKKTQERFRASELPSMLDLVLWVSHPVLYSDELELVAAAVCVMSHLATTPGDGATALLRSLCPVDVLEQRPAMRELELAHVVASAYAVVANCLETLGLGSAVSRTPPHRFFSAALLHCVSSIGFAAWRLSLPSELVDEITAAVTRCTERIKEGRGASAVIAGAAPAQSRSSLKWIGVLQRDHLADLLDQGGPSAVVPNGGVAIKLRGNTGSVSIQSSSAAKPLPITEFLDQILDAIRSHRVVCIQGETGCGKSSMIPLQLLEDACRRGERVSILVTQPRRIAATSLAARVASLLGEPVGQRVGYRIGGGASFHRESSKTVLRFITTGYLLEAFVSGSRLWNECTHIVLDEVHERCLQTDMLSLVIKLRMKAWLEDHRLKTWLQAQAHGARDHSAKPASGVDSSLDSRQSTEDKKLVVMSATIQANMFSEYFAPLTSHGDVPSLFVGAKRYDVEELYLDELLSPTDNDGDAAAADRPKPAKFVEQLPLDVKNTLQAYAKRLHSVKGPHSRPFSLRNDVRAIADIALACVAPNTTVLVFLPGLEDIEGTLEAITLVSKALTVRHSPSVQDADGLRPGAPTIRVFALHSIVDMEEQEMIVAPAKSGECKVVLATNIAETSLTIPDVKVVIDCGMVKRVEYDPERKMRALRVAWASRSAAKQRAGRAGRVSNGMVIRMYSRHIYERIMPDFDPSDILPLEYAVLQIKRSLSAYGDVLSVMTRLIEPPPEAAVTLALDQLVEWNALGPAPDFELLELGEVALRLPCDVSLTKAILLGASLGCAAEMVVVAASQLAQRPSVMRPLRVFFDFEHDYNEAVAKYARTVAYLDRGWRSDIHQLLALVEETAHLSPQPIFGLRTRRPNPLEVSGRQVLALLRHASHLASLTLALDLALTPQDRQLLVRLSALQRQESSDSADRRQPVRFPSLVRDSAESVTLMCALAFTAELVCTSVIRQISSFAGTVARAIAQRDETGVNCVAAQVDESRVWICRAPKALLAADLPSLVAAFSAICGTRVHVIRPLNSATLVVTVPSLVQVTPKSSRNSGVTEPSQAEKMFEVVPLHFSVQAVALHARVNPKRAVQVPLDPEGDVVFALTDELQIATRAVHDRARFVRDGVVQVQQVRHDRWGALSCPPAVLRPVGTTNSTAVITNTPRPLVALALSSMLVGTQLTATLGTEIRAVEFPSLPFLAIMSSRIIAACMKPSAGNITVAVATPAEQGRELMVGLDPALEIPLGCFAAPLHTLCEVNLLLALNVLSQSVSLFPQDVSKLRSALIACLLCEDNFVSWHDVDCAVASAKRAASAWEAAARVQKTAAKNLTIVLPDEVVPDDAHLDPNSHIAVKYVTETITVPGTQRPFSIRQLVLPASVYDSLPTDKRESVRLLDRLFGRQLKIVARRAVPASSRLLTPAGGEATTPVIFSVRSVVGITRRPLHDHDRAPNHPVNVLLPTSPFPRGSPKFKCLNCDVTNVQYDNIKKHMKTCCPESAGLNDRRVRCMYAQSLACGLVHAVPDAASVDSAFVQTVVARPATVTIAHVTESPPMLRPNTDRAVTPSQSVVSVAMLNDAERAPSHPVNVLLPSEFPKAFPRSKCLRCDVTGATHRVLQHMEACYPLGAKLGDSRVRSMYAQSLSCGLVDAVQDSTQRDCTPATRFTVEATATSEPKAGRVAEPRQCPSTGLGTTYRRSLNDPTRDVNHPVNVLLPSKPFPKASPTYKCLECDVTGKYNVVLQHMNVCCPRGAMLNDRRKRCMYAQSVACGLLVPVRGDDHSGTAAADPILVPTVSAVGEADGRMMDVAESSPTPISSAPTESVPISTVIEDSRATASRAT